jgi:hypothetical protein
LISITPGVTLDEILRKSRVLSPVPAMEITPLINVTPSKFITRPLNGHGKPINQGNPSQNIPKPTFFNAGRSIVLRSGRSESLNLSPIRFSKLEDIYTRLGLDFTKNFRTGRLFHGGLSPPNQGFRLKRRRVG